MPFHSSGVAGQPTPLQKHLDFRALPNFVRGGTLEIFFRITLICGLTVRPFEAPMERYSSSVVASGVGDTYAAVSEGNRPGSEFLARALERGLLAIKHGLS